MVHGGATLTHLADGRVALVRGGLPGETVEASLGMRSGVMQGGVTQVLGASPGRVPASPHPGLDYSFATYERQLTLKREVTADALTRSLKRQVEVPEVVPAPSAWHYRHTVQPAATKRGLGYRKPNGQEVATLAADPVAHESINRVWEGWQSAPEGVPKGIREVVFRCNDAGEVLVSLVASASPKNYLSFAHNLLRRDIGVVGVSYALHDPRGRFRSGFERLAGGRTLTQRYGDFEVSVSATSFAQPNPAAASLLYDELKKWAGSGGSALDLYAGTGIIGLHLAQQFGEVTALEVDKSSVIRGERDAARLGVQNLNFIRADAKKLGPLPDAELIVVDPPRAGLAKGVREALLGSSAKRLLYVSCDVATWARDVAHFGSEGLKLTRLQPFDFYAQTHHVEMLSLLER